MLNINQYWIYSKMLVFGIQSLTSSDGVLTSVGDDEMVGLPEGINDGVGVGTLDVDGCSLELFEGPIDGLDDGDSLGSIEGRRDGSLDADGFNDGVPLSCTEGKAVGLFDVDGCRQKICFQISWRACECAMCLL